MPTPGKRSAPESVRIENVTKTFRDPATGRENTVVRDVSLDIAPGELVTLLGPSGCGKTTTLRMVAGFETPTSGRVFIGSDDVTQLPPNKRDTAMVFQSYGLFPHMNVRENVAYGLKLRKRPAREIDERVAAMLAMVGLKGYETRPPSRLSGGQQQRVALARSLIVEPGVLLLDEPLSNLDALLREQMRVEIRRLQRSLGITALYVTHDRVEAMSLSDRIVVMRSGEIVQTGSPQEIYRNPTSVFTAGFVGKATFFPGVFRSGAVEIRGRTIRVARFAPELKDGDACAVMCRPESLVLLPPGEGVAEGIVIANIYLGHSVEAVIRPVATDGGDSAPTEAQSADFIVQIDNPHQEHADAPDGALRSRIYPEGARVSVGIDPALAKALVPEAE